MSYFAFGEIVLRAGISDTWLVDLSFELEVHSLRERIFIQLGPGIKQKLVFDILNEQRWPSKEKTLPFLFTSSPLADTSHELIALPDMVPQNHAEWTDVLEKNLGKIAKVLSVALSLKEVELITLIFSEGYDTTYDFAEAHIDAMPKTVIRKCGADYEVPSLKLVLKN